MQHWDYVEYLGIGFGAQIIAKIILLFEFQYLFISHRESSYIKFPQIYLTNEISCVSLYANNILLFVLPMT